VRQRPLTPRLTAVALAGAVVALDQLTKWWALVGLDEGPKELLGDFFQLRLVRNPGAAFGALQGSGSIIALLAIVVAVAIFVSLRDAPNRVTVWALALVMGGALGNLIDRVWRGDGLFDGEVVDFLDFSFWPTFNVADSAITVGALLALWEGLRSDSSHKSQSNSMESAPTE